VYTVRESVIGLVGDVGTVEWLKVECESKPKSNWYHELTTLIRRMIGVRALRRPNMSVKLRSICVVAVALGTPATREVVPGDSWKTEEKFIITPVSFGADGYPSDDATSTRRPVEASRSVR
jgi:hypothetical protein